MGVVIRQSIYTTLFSYIGIALGYVNVVLLFPEVLLAHEYGLTRILHSVVNLGTQVGTLGLSNSLIRFFPYYQSKEKKHHGILVLIVLGAMLGFVLVSSVLLIFKPSILAQYTDSNLFGTYYYLLFPLLLSEVVFSLMDSYARALLKPSFPLLIKQIVNRVMITGLLLSYKPLLNGDFDKFLPIYIAIYFVQVLLMLGYFLKLNAIQVTSPFNHFRKRRLKVLANYSFYTLLAQVSGVFLINIDIIMVGAILGLEDVAFYAVAFYIATVVEVPKRGIGTISLPLLAKAWKEKDTEEVQNLYSKTALNQLILGLLIYILIIVNIESIFYFLPNEYAIGKPVLYIAGLGKLIDVSFGINTGVISTSRFYRFTFYFQLLLVLLAIITNIILIPLIGIEGAAIATASTFLIYNLAKYAFLKIKLQMEPFSRKNFIAIGIGLIAFGAGYAIPQMDSVLADIAIRTVTVGVLFSVPIYALKVSEDINAIFDHALHLLRIKRK